MPPPRSPPSAATAPSRCGMSRSRPVTSITVPGGGTTAGRPQLQDHGHGELDRLPSRADPMRVESHLDPGRRLPHLCGPDHPHERLAGHLAAHDGRRTRVDPGRQRRRALRDARASAAAIDAEQHAAGREEYGPCPAFPRGDDGGSGTGAMTGAAMTMAATTPTASTRALASCRAVIDDGSDTAHVVRAAPSQAPAAGTRRRPSITRARDRAPARGRRRRSPTPPRAPRRTGRPRWPCASR